MKNKPRHIVICEDCKTESARHLVTLEDYTKVYVCDKCFLGRKNKSIGEIK